MANHEGFTNTELMAVVIIISLIAAFAIPRFIAVQDEATCRSALLEIYDAQHEYCEKNGVYARNLGDLKLITSTPGLSVTPYPNDTTFATATKRRIIATLNEDGTITCSYTD